MRQSNVILLAICLMYSLFSTSLADEDRDFVPLFDGETLEGWRGYQQDKIPDNWTVEDGAIRGSGEGVDLITESKFGDFDLKFEWKIAPGGNSGVIYRVSEDQKMTYHTGPEYQVLDDSRFAEKVSPTVSAGALYALYGASEKLFQSAGEFNTSRIVARGNHIEHWLNGTKIVDCEMGSDDWNKKVAASKFHAWPGFAKNQQGHVALQSHGSPVWYKNLRIKKLVPESEK